MRRRLRAAGLSMRVRPVAQRLLNRSQRASGRSGSPRRGAGSAWADSPALFVREAILDYMGTLVDKDLANGKEFTFLLTP